MANYGKVKIKDLPVLISDKSIYCEGGGRLLSDIMWPVGSVYISVNNTNPSTYWGGTWVKIASGRVLMGASNDNQLNTTVNSGLPDIYGAVGMGWGDSSAPTLIFNRGYSGALSYYNDGSTSYFTSSNNGSGTHYNQTIRFRASDYNSIYGASSIVQPPAYYVYMWRRTA